MKPSQRFGVFLICLAAVLLLGIIFRSFLIENIIMPAAMVVWLLLRIFVLSIDQKIYWGLLILVLAIFVGRRFAQPSKSTTQYLPYEANATLENINYWRTFIRLAPEEAGAHKVVRRDLARLLVEMLEAQQPGATPAILYEALQQRKIDLPEPVYRFLFAYDHRLSKPPLQWRVRNALAAPRRWLRRLTGQEQADYYRALEETFNFLEASLEIPHDH